MAFCAKCGAQLTAGSGFCGSCGAAAPGQSVTPSTGAAVQPAQAGTSGITDNVAAALSYIWIVGLIFLFIEPYNKKRFVRFHAMQSVLYAAAAFVFWIGLHIVGLIAGAVTSGIAWLILGPLSILVWLAMIAFWVILVIKAYNNQEFKAPIIGNIAAQQVANLQ
jgi:uncharacterized membrane protein